MSGKQHKQPIKRSPCGILPFLDSFALRKEKNSAIENFSDEDEEGVEDYCPQDDVPLPTLRFEHGESSESEIETEDTTPPIVFSRDWRWRMKSDSFPIFESLFKPAEVTNVVEP